ncbi:hypothetical protein [Nitrosospira sp. Nsp1]|uniref:hypothetical protein n=1 Tax=Nitrosospira sp. Nsp1 TaxID=136547 RepID=UPI0008871475|nr:hypothetical protein [Nitrosospira sp. Nsp1]SCX37541.1 hypothetical protein SAMN05720354_101126 [Nitrosospira sp. Nsp1]
MTINRICAIALSLIATSTAAGGFSSRGDHEELVNNVIVYVGLLSEAADLQDSSYSLQTEKLYRLGGYCFYSNYIFGYAPAMIVVDKHEQPRVAVFDKRYSDIDVRLYSVRFLDCNEIRKAKNQQTHDNIKAKMNEVMDEIERQRQRSAQMLQEFERKKMQK